MGRFVSAVTGLAVSNGSSVRFTQMLRVPFKGLMKAIYFPSGEICAPEISGSPKNNSRSIRAGCALGWPKARLGEAAVNSPTHTRTEPITKDLLEKLRRAI